MLVHTTMGLIREVTTVVLTVTKPIFPDALTGAGTAHIAHILQTLSLCIHTLQLIFFSHTVRIPITAPRLWDAGARDVTQKFHASAQASTWKSWVHTMILICCNSIKVELQQNFQICIAGVLSLF